MHDVAASALFNIDLSGWIYSSAMFLKVLVGFSLIIFVHELGHFLAAKWVGVRVDRFSVGFGYRLIGYRKGEGVTFGNRPNYGVAELEARGYGETDYCFQALPIGGYVKMMGHDDINIDEKTGEMQTTKDPRAFINRPVGHRMIVASAGVLFNILFAAVALMAVFLLGIDMEAPVIGFVHPEGPSAGKLRAGDRLLEVDGARAHAFRDLRFAELLSDGPIRVRVERDGKPLDEFEITPLPDESRRFRSVGVEQMATTTLATDGEPAGDLPRLKARDRIISIVKNGQATPVNSAYDIENAFRVSGGKEVEFEVQRPRADTPGEHETLRAFQRPMLFVLPSGTPGRAITADQHILGFLRRPMIDGLAPGKPAIKAGLKIGDVIAEWGPVSSPVHPEILEQIRGSGGKPMRVVVERGAERVSVELKAETPFSITGSGRPRVGLVFGRAEEQKPIVADVVPGTPAAALQMPRGSLILALDGQPVSNWFEVTEALKRAAGRSITLRYRTGADEVEGVLAVPASIISALNLPETVRVLSIDGRDSVSVPAQTNGEPRTLRLPDPTALRMLLAERAGKRVVVRYADTPQSTPQETTWLVDAAAVEPWQMRVVYMCNLRQFEELRETVDADGNPILAMKMGAKMVIGEVFRVYQFLGQLSRQNVSTEYMAGPVGIFGAAIEQAKLGLPDLLQFLAILSINLAVINFLPLPVMDGGLMVFLIIEKLKGKPLSIRTQMISTLVGLAVILLVGVLVTIQDISRFLS